MNILEFIKSTVKKTIIREGFQRGEWWIDDSGGTIFADGDNGDMNHEAVIIQILTNNILSHFGIDIDDLGEFGNYEDLIKQNLIEDGRLSEEEIQEWDTKSPSEIILIKLNEDKLFETPEQTEDALYIAYGSSTRDARIYGMKYMGWKVAKMYGNKMEVQTWTLTERDLSIIVRGLNDILEDDFGDDEPDDEEEKNLVNITVVRTSKIYRDIPLSVLEKRTVSSVLNYKRDLPWMNEDYHKHHKDYRMLEGNRMITVVFENNTRLQFEIHFRNNHGEDREKHSKKAASKWRSLASKIRNESKELNEVGNQVEKTWKECFEEALQHPELKEFIRDKPHQQIYRNV